MSTMEQNIKSCPHCSEEFTNKTAWKDHMLKTHNILAYTCDLCPKTFFEQADFIHHFDFEHKSDFNRHVCSYCGVSYKWFKFLNKHIKDKHQIEKLMECNACGEEFYNSVAFKKHLRLKHSGGWKFHKCRKCHRSFTARELIVLHDKFDHSRNGDHHFREYAATHLTIEDEDLLENSKKCTKCNLEYTSSIYLMKHLKTTHNKHKYFRCCKCEDAFYNTRAGLSIHLYYEHGVPREHKCNKCRYGYSKAFVNKIRKNKENLTKDRLIDESEAVLPYWARDFVKEELPNSVDLVGATEREIQNLCNNIKNLFHVLSTVPPSKLRGTTVVDPYLQFHSARKKLSDDLRRDCRRRDEKHFTNTNGTSEPTEIERPKRKLVFNKSTNEVSPAKRKRDEIPEAHLNANDEKVCEIRNLNTETRKPRQTKNSDDIAKEHNSGLSDDTSLQDHDNVKNSTEVKEKPPLNRSTKSSEDRAIHNEKRSRSSDKSSKDVVKESEVIGKRVKSMDSQRVKQINDKNLDATTEITDKSDKSKVTSKDTTTEKTFMTTKEKNPTPDSPRPKRKTGKNTDVNHGKTPKSDKVTNKEKISEKSSIANGNTTVALDSQRPKRNTETLKTPPKKPESNNRNSDSTASAKKTQIAGSKNKISAKEDINQVIVNSETLISNNQRPKRNKDISTDHVRSIEKNPVSNKKSKNISNGKDIDLDASQVKNTSLDNKRRTRNNTTDVTIKKSPNTNEKSEKNLNSDNQRPIRVKQSSARKDQRVGNTEETKESAKTAKALSYTNKMPVFQCNECHSQFTLRSEIIKHFATHHQSMENSLEQNGDSVDFVHDDPIMPIVMELLKYKCDLCKTEFEDQLLLLNHLTESHSSSEVNEKSKQVYKCIKCGAGFRDKDALNEHMNIHVDNKCFLCNKTFRDAKGLRLHRLRVHNKKVFTCDKCKCEFASEQDMNKHICGVSPDIHKDDGGNSESPVHKNKENVDNTIEEEKQANRQIFARIKTGEPKRLYKCLKCDFKSTNRTILLTHIQQIHKVAINKVFKCDQCNAAFKMADKLKQHLVFKHSRTEKKLPVIRIKKSKLSTVTLQNAGRINLLNSLISSSLNKSMHNCKICFSYFPSRELLQRHIQWEHTKNVNLHKCGQCGLVLYSVEDLEIHMHSTHSLDTIIKWKKQIANTYVKQTDVFDGE